MENIEIKAKIHDIDRVISKAKELSNNDGKIIKQHDVFFNATKSRLKLRKFEVSVLSNFLFIIYLLAYKNANFYNWNIFFMRSYNIHSCTCT